MKNENCLAIALTYVGTIIGAGFASGQEIRKFFVDFGEIGAISFLFATFLFFYLGKKIMDMGFESKSTSYDRVLTYAFTCKAKKFFDFVIILFLISTVTIMFSGMGALLNQNFGYSQYIGSLLMLIVSTLIILGGIDKVMKLSLIAIPVLIISTLLIAFNSFNLSDVSVVYLSNNVFNSLFSGLTYVSFNMIMAIAVLPVLGNVAGSSKKIKKSAFIASLIIGFFGIIIFYALLMNYSVIQFAEIPLGLLASRSNGIYNILYLVSFIIAVTTTAVSALYGVYTRLEKNYFKFGVIIALAYICSLSGFSILVKYVYSFMGYIGFVVIFMLLYGFSKRKRIKDK